MASIEVREEDVALLKILKDDGVLKPVNVEHLVAKNGAALIFCGDCDHSDDIWRHFQKLLSDAKKPNRIFPVSRAGGSIWVPKSDLLIQAGLPRDEDIFFDLSIACDKKDVFTIFPTVHAPCGAGGLYGLSLFDQIELLVLSKERIKEKYGYIEGLEVKVFIHICYPGIRRRTYFTSAEIWNAKREEYRKYDYSPGRLFSAKAA